ncbi:L,D-transpeptidase family protein [Nitrosomonas supralitoralis]|uniref:Murein L,D-transpeptidase n=1 Tax=Nitrosomonas supralitoralis TaxID=2116706 RepID=A0A2P7NZR4_9PROT|nr:L,D-transpeptidase family protein [Nitrosomonas supralitoralis]PSJ18979.1 murein L,D-transpeptidase [Nitrosomonas supralitoralis]
MTRYQSQSALLTTLRFLCYLLFLLNPITSAALIIDSRGIEQQLSNSATGLRKTEIDDLQRFYAARKFQPLWITGEPGLSQLKTALAFIASAEAEGLESQDYQLQQLTQLLQQIDQSSSAAIELEVRTTHALLKLARDLSRGRFSATAIDRDWHIPQPEFDAIAFLQEAIRSNHLEQSLQKLSPQTSNYQLLKQTLTHYQALLRDSIEWIRIPSSPSIRPGDIYDSIPLIRQRMAQAYMADGLSEFNLIPSESQLYDTELVTAIKAFQEQHGLNTDGIIGKNTINALNIPLEWKVRQLRINMERLRWLPRDLGQRHLLINTAGFYLTAVENDEPVLNMRIIVGRDYRSTPSFNGALSYMVLNPYWNVPASIARKDLLPKQQQDPTYFTTAGFKVFPAQERGAQAIDPDTIDWNAIKRGFPYFLRQDPGSHNSLGKIKFMFSNPFSIYLHDTPSKSLFRKDIRTFSSGCIRLEKPFELAAFALKKQSLPEKFSADLVSDKTITTHLPKPLPLYMVYITAWADEQNKVHFYPDIYDRDLRALRHARW